MMRDRFGRPQAMQRNKGCRISIGLCTTGNKRIVFMHFAPAAKPAVEQQIIVLCTNQIGHMSIHYVVRLPHEMETIY